MVQTIVLQLEDVEDAKLAVPSQASIIRLSGLTNGLCRVVLKEAIAKGQVFDRPVAFAEALSYLMDLEDEDDVRTAHRVVEALYNAEDVATLRGLLETACKAVPWRPPPEKAEKAAV